MKGLVRVGTDLQGDLVTNADVCNVLFRHDELRGNGVHFVHLRNQVSLPDELARQFLQLSRRRRDDPRDGAYDGQESQLLLEVTPLGFEPFDLRLRLLDLLRTDAAQQGAQLALCLDEIVGGRGRRLFLVFNSARATRPSANRLRNLASRDCAYVSAAAALDTAAFATSTSSGVGPLSSIASLARASLMSALVFSRSVSTSLSERRAMTSPALTLSPSST